MTCRFLVYYLVLFNINRGSSILVTDAARIPADRRRRWECAIGFHISFEWVSQNLNFSFKLSKLPSLCDLGRSCRNDSSRVNFYTMVPQGRAGLFGTKLLKLFLSCNFFLFKKMYAIILVPYCSPVFPLSKSSFESSFC